MCSIQQQKSGRTIDRTNERTNERLFRQASDDRFQSNRIHDDDDDDDDYDRISYFNIYSQSAEHYTKIKIKYPSTQGKHR